MSEPLVVAEDVSRWFGTRETTTQAVRNATCTVKAGERIALVGRSGSGKSTLLHLLAGLDLPSAGIVQWPALGPREGLRPGQVAIAFQGPSLLTPLSVLENARFPLLMLDLPEQQATERAGETLARFGVSHLRDKLPEEISGGQAQRVALARALSTGPALLLADEPTGQLDSAGAEQVISALLNVFAELGAAMIVATHDPLVAQRFDVIWQMENGRLLTGARCHT